MNDLLTLSATTLGIFLIVLLRYFFTAGAACWFCWVVKRDQLGHRRIDSTFATGSSPFADSPAQSRDGARSGFRLQIRNEIFHSVVTSVIFAVAGALLLLACQGGWTRVYLDMPRHGWGSFIASFWIAAFIHETYFYWTHRWMHLPRFFKPVHRVHHDSKIPTPWAAFSFHPWEALIEALILPLIVFIMPLHPAVILANLTFMTVLGVINHTGYELYPRGFARNIFWKHWMGIQHAEYEQSYEALHARRFSS